MDNGCIHLLLHTERFATHQTKNVHYVRAWRREKVNGDAHTFQCFVLTHSTDRGLYYEERYDTLNALAKRKARILSYWRKKH